MGAPVFSYNPGVQDRRGELMARGIEQAGDAIAHGITQYRAKIDEKKAEDAAVEWMSKNGAKYGMNVLDEKELKAAVKAAGGGKQAIQLISALQEQAQQAKLREAQLQELEAQRSAREQRQRATMAAQAPIATTRPRTPAEGAFVMRDPNVATTRQPTPDEAVAQYLSAGGDTAGAENLAQSYMYLEKLRDSGRPFMPSLIDLGGGVSAMTTSKGSAVPVTKGAPKPATQDVNVGGRTLKVGPGNKYFDEKGNPVDFAQEKPMSATDWIISGQKPEDYRAYRDKFARATSGEKAADAAKNDEPKQITTSEEFAKLKKGERFMWNGKVGIKK